MPFTFRPFLAPICGVVFAALFYNESIGINVLLFEIPLFAWLLYHQRDYMSRPLFRFSTVLWAISLICVPLVHSQLAIFSHMVFLALWVGTATVFSFRNVHFAWLQGVVSIPVSIANAWKTRSENGNIGRIALPKLRTALALIVPLLLVGVFLVLYSGSNPLFDKATERSFDLLSRSVFKFFEHLNFQIISLFLTGVFLAIWLLHPQNMQRWRGIDESSPFSIFRQRRVAKATDVARLQSWIRSAYLVLITLNALLLVVNITDIWFVLFQFEWQGQYLTDFVHQSTWTLLASIVLSATIILLIFRGPMHWYSRNRWLKVLSYAWLIQNALLAFSVLVRNIIYIQHFALAYKRIAVIVFLGLIIFGLYTVWIKIRRTHSLSFVIHKNVAAFFVALSICSLVNWDILIARYNISKGGEAFVHLDFLVTLSDVALPHLHVAPDKLGQWQEFQSDQFRLSGDFISPEEYLYVITHREEVFVEDYQRRSWLSWNLPEYLAYRRIVVF
jgi:hypothetical protein